MNTYISANEMIELLKEKWPKLDIALRSEFTGNEEDQGLWFRSSYIEVQIDDLRVPLPLIDDNAEVIQELDDFLSSYGWMAEPYDSGTLMAFPN